MTLLEVFGAISGNLIPVMAVVLLVALAFRYVIFMSGKRDNTYFKTFSETVEKLLETDDKNEKIDNVDFWITQLLHRVTSRLPDRNLRFKKFKEKGGNDSFRNQHRESFSDFADGKRSIVHSVKQNIDAFRSPHPPNFHQLTLRILNQDKKWTTILGVVPLDKLSRMLDILPGLFIIGGIFGTFLGITAALPTIATIDLSKLDEAGPILNNFVANVAFSMNTSITGIICSVIMTVLNTLYPVVLVRNQVVKNLEHCFEFMWFRIHGEKIPLGEKMMLDQLERIANLLDNGKKSAATNKEPKSKAS